MSRQLIILAISVTLSVLVASALAGEIHDAARSGDLERVEAILANDPHLVNTKDENVDTPLHLASRDGHRAVVELLLAKGAAIDAGDRENSSALDVAAQAGRGEIVEFLIANGAGVGFLVKVDGLSIYHAGDRAGWAEGAREGYIREIDYLAGHVRELDLAFLNVTGCHAHGREPLREGTLYTLRKLSPKVMIPTHAGDREYIYRQAAEEAAQEDLNTKLHYPENRGDRFIYRSGNIQ